MRRNISSKRCRPIQNLRWRGSISASRCSINKKRKPRETCFSTAAQQLPKDPYAWYNLGLAYKDLADPKPGVAAFEHVTEILPEETDAYYFVGYLNSQLQQYDQAIAAYQKGLAAFPNHASSEFGIARAYQRKGDSAAAQRASR